jgi:hypothetical protein
MQSVEESQLIKSITQAIMILTINGKTMTISNAMIQFNPSQVNLKNLTPQ